MSKGSKVVPVRIPDELYIRMIAQIDKTNERRKEEEFDVSSFIRKAIEDKLDHANRSRCWRASRQLGECKGLGLLYNAKDHGKPGSDHIPFGEDRTTDSSGG